MVRGAQIGDWGGWAPPYGTNIALPCRPAGAKPQLPIAITYLQRINWKGRWDWLIRANMSKVCKKLKTQVKHKDWDWLAGTRVPTLESMVRIWEEPRNKEAWFSPGLTKYCFMFWVIIRFLLWAPARRVPDLDRQRLDKMLAPPFDHDCPHIFMILCSHLKHLHMSKKYDFWG